MKMIKCKPGNKPCGKRCIPNKWECDKDGTPKEPRKGSKLKTALIATSLGLAAVAAGAIIFNKIKSGKLEKTKVKEVNTQSEIDNDFELSLKDINFNREEEEVIKDFKSILEKDANPQIKKDLDKAITKTITAKELNKQYEVNPEIMAKIPSDVKISLADTNQQVFKDLGIEGIDAVYIPEYNKLIVSSSPSEDLSENLNRGLVHWYQNNKGLMMDYEDYENAMANLTPVQKIIFDNVEETFRKIWHSQSVKLLLKDENKYGHMSRPYNAFKRAEFEAFYLSVNWDKLEKTAKEQGLI